MSLKENLKDWLLKEITGGAYDIGDKIPSEYSIAERFKVNKTTANKAVSELVSMGYVRRCRGAAGTVVTRNRVFPRGSIGFYISLGSVSYFSSLLTGAQQGAFLKDYTLQYFDSNNNHDYKYVVDCIANSGVSGLLVSHTAGLPQDLDIPVVYINDTPEKECSSILTDNYDGGCKIGRYLAQLGHRNTAFIRQSHIPTTLFKRYEGYLKAMSECGGRTIDFVYEPGLSRMDLLWKKIKTDMQEVTAIACDGDQVALRLYQHLTDVGIKVPEDISITGFSFLREVQSTLGITSIFDNPLEAGYHAANLLIDQIENKSDETVTELMPVELKIGTTTCPPRK